ncbi:MAG: hypothetical protein RL172_618 [Bacteroidota bacterium]
MGASANNRGKYAFFVKPGTYTLVCQHIGYATQEKSVTITDTDEELAFFLQQQKLELKEVVVKSGAEDPAYAIIRKAIKMRPQYNQQVNAFTCNLYTKDMIKLRRLPKKILGQKIPETDRNDMGLDTTGAGIVYLAESVASIASQKPNKFKLEIKSSRVSGSDGFGFTFPTFISFYQNNVSIFTQKLNPRGFISPIADGALNFYRYKYLGSFWEDGKEVNSIQVIPKRNYEPLFAGVINITENDWRIHSTDLLLTKLSQLEIIDSLQIIQFHVPVNNDTWQIKNQLLHFSFSQFGIDATGNFVSAYSDYNLQPNLHKGFFDNVVIKYDSGVSNRPKAYWDTIRPIPLEKEEIRDYIIKDSMLEVHKDSAKSQLAADILNAQQGRINPIKFFWGGVNRTHYTQNSSLQWSFSPLIRNIEYNPAEGLVLNAEGSFSKYIRQARTNFSIRPSLRYGFNNQHLNGAIEVVLRTRDTEPMGKIKRETWTFAGGRRVTQFNRESPISPLINTFSTLLYGDNFMKTYENVFGMAGFSKRFESGLRLSINALYENRTPLNNTSNFTLFKKDSVKITPNYPYEKIDQQFTPHKAVLLSVDISYKPGQRYIQFPNSKVPLGSKYPTFSAHYTKGLNGVLGSGVDFDEWKLAVQDNLNLKIGGLLKYKLSIGGFFNNRKVFIQDYQHFNGNLTIAASEYVNSFQLVSYYAFSTITDFYGLAHLEHHFNGLLTNKIPLFKKLNWHLVAGTNTFFINDRNNHVELFAGFENILKIFRVDIVAGYDNGKYTGTGLRIGFGGLIGGNMNINRKAGTVSFSF